MLTAAARHRGTAEHRQDHIFYLEHENTDCLIQASRYLFISKQRPRSSRKAHYQPLSNLGVSLTNESRIFSHNETRKQLHPSTPCAETKPTTTRKNFGGSTMLF